MSTPVTLLSGFLGSGKTTLVRRILEENHGQRCAVIVNEFGAVGIDGDLLDAARVQRSGQSDGDPGAGSALVELANGCICCEIQDDLRTTLLALVDRAPASEGNDARSGMARWLRRPRASRSGPAFDRVIVEASGAASPGPAVQTFLIDGVLQERVHLDGVITLAHAALIEDQLKTTAEAADQIAYADRIVLNHADRVTEERAASTLAQLRHWNPLAEARLATRARVPVDWLLDVGGARRMAAGLQGVGDAASPAADGAFQHTRGLSSISLVAEDAIDADALVIWLEFLSKRRSHELMRAKGIVAARGPGGAAPKRRVIQGVYRWLEVTDDERAAAPAKSHLVLIGRDLDEAEVRRGWAAVTSPESGLG